MSTFIVSARTDGRGGIKPFGTYGKNQAGAKVQIGRKWFIVTKDGRVNIPKRVMDKGIRGKDGRMRIEITFKTEPGKSNWKRVFALTSKPLAKDKNKGTGDKPSKYRIKSRDEIYPADTGDVNWSPT